MAGSRVREFRPDDLGQIEVRGALVLQARDAAVLGETLYEAGPAITWPEIGAPVASCGVTGDVEGVGRLWALIGDGFSARVARDVADVLFNSWMHQLGLRRLQTTVCVTDETALRFSDWLGFRREGVLRAYGPDGDHWMVALCHS